MIGFVAFLPWESPRERGSFFCSRCFPAGLALLLPLFTTTADARAANFRSPWPCVPLFCRTAWCRRATSFRARSLVLRVREPPPRGTLLLLPRRKELLLRPARQTTTRLSLRAEAVQQRLCLVRCRSRAFEHSLSPASEMPACASDRNQKRRPCGVQYWRLAFPSPPPPRARLVGT